MLLLICLNFIQLATIRSLIIQGFFMHSFPPALLLLNYSPGARNLCRVFLLGVAEASPEMPAALQGLFYEA